MMLSWITKDFRYKDASDLHCEFWGYRRGDMRGIHVSNIIGEDMFLKVRPIYEVSMRDRKVVKFSTVLNGVPHDITFTPNLSVGGENDGLAISASPIECHCSPVVREIDRSEIKRHFRPHETLAGKVFAVLVSDAHCRAMEEHSKLFHNSKAVSIREQIRQAVRSAIHHPADPEGIRAIRTFGLPEVGIEPVIAGGDEMARGVPFLMHIPEDTIDGVDLHALEVEIGRILVAHHERECSDGSPPHREPPEDS